MIDIKKEKAQIPDDNKPWPLLVVSTNETPSRKRADNHAEAAFRALVENACLAALRRLREAGRVGDVKMLKLYCYNSKEAK